jgi:hypothetical protein
MKNTQHQTMNTNIGALVEIQRTTDTSPLHPDDERGTGALTAPSSEIPPIEQHLVENPKELRYSDRKVYGTKE